MRLSLGYLTADDEVIMLRRRLDRREEAARLTAVTSAAELIAMRASLEQVEVSPDLLEYVVAIIRATRTHAQVQVGASPRGALALVQLGRAQALLRERDYVIPDDIKAIAGPALAHRVSIRPELWVRQVKSEDVIAQILTSVATPQTDPAAVVV
jgi:MoxR-like ATPase